MFIIDDLLLWLPAKGLLGVFKKVHDLAEEELNDENALKKELLKCQMQYDLGLIPKKEFEKKEDEILKQINEIYKQKKQKGRI